MDYYSFINSKDIRDYLRRLGYKFNTVEAAWLIYQCRLATIEEKHRAFTELTETMPDCGIMRRINCMQIGSIHDFIKRYISIQNKYLRKIELEEDGWVYRFRCYYPESGWDVAESMLFSTFLKCRAYIEAEYANADIMLFKVEKLKLDNDNVYIHAIYNNRFEAMDIELGYMISDDDADVLDNSFFGLWFNFPTPFEKGDIVWNPNVLSEGPVVVKYVGGQGLTEERISMMYAHNDYTDMDVVGYYINKTTGHLYYDVTWNYMDYEYCPEEQYMKYKSVICMSSFLKGEIEEDLFADAYHYAVLSKYTGDEKPCYTRQGLVLAGVEDARHVKIWLDDERPAPEGYIHCKSVNEAKARIRGCEYDGDVIDIIDCDHDLGKYAAEGGDGIKLLDWLVERDTFYPVALHTMNSAAREYMQREIDRYWPDNNKNEHFVQIRYV